MKLIDELKKRELYFNQTDPSLDEALENESLTFYLGADPTADSLHVGHLVQYLTAKRLQNKGHKPILLIGGATGQIGDPRQQGERSMLDQDIITNYTNALTNQVKKIFEIEDVVNNYDWCKDINMLTFLRDYGKHFNVNNMLNKEIVRSRLETGISFTEFSYQILQSLDWHHLYTTRNCKMQLAGQDQWGNITAGTDLIRKLCGSEAKVYGLTGPLIVRADGTKFGKSAGGLTVWLDSKKTSVYDFYQFWINTPDNDAIKRLRQFTFLSLEEIDQIEEGFGKEPHLRSAQKILAKEVTTFVHGEKACNQAIKISESLFSGDIKVLTANEISMGFSDLECLNVDDNVELVDALISTQLASSKREAKEFIASGAVSINGDKFIDVLGILNKEQAIENTYIVLRRGKKKYALIKFN